MVEPTPTLVTPAKDEHPGYVRPSMVSEPVLRILSAISTAKRLAGKETGASLDEMGDALGVPTLQRAKLALSLKDSAKDGLIEISREAKNDFQYRYTPTERLADLLRWIDEEVDPRMDIEGTDRYEALGIAPPDPETMCEGECEGTGVVPVERDTPGFEQLWANAEEVEHAEDGWHFVQCPDCAGTGLRA